jgi:hypothetical protein
MPGSATLRAIFLLLGLILGALFVLGVQRAWQRTGASEDEVRRATARAAVATVLWLSLTLAAAAAGRLRFDPNQPTMMLLAGIVIVGCLYLGFSRVGARLAAGLSLAALVGVQSFRLPLELAMQRAYSEGVMPVQMSYSGYNFDIVTGILAILVAAGLAGGWLGRWAAWVWNGIGVLLLLNVVVIAILATPLVHVIVTDPPNTWITRPPYVWLPAVMVATALLGHIVVFRRLQLESSKPSS